MVRQTIFGLAAFFLLGACASTPDASGDSSAIEGSKKADRLQARNLAAGECGIFVWTADSSRRFILFSQLENPLGSWWSDTKEVYITRTSSEGFSTYDQPPIQSFTMPDGGTLSLNLEQPEEISNGTRYKSGSIALKSADGWDKVMPVIGLAGCQIAQN